MDEITVDAVVENLDAITDFVDEKLEALDCPMKAMTQINIAIDELFSNIAYYAYSPEVGPATVRVEVTEDSQYVRITFVDGGMPFDPLSKEDPDITASVDERSVGGLGIMMVKKTMDEVRYEYRDGKNILEIKKKL